MDPGSDAVLTHLERLFTSHTFRNAPRLREFLRFVVQETLTGRAADIKEYAIACAVCGRPPSFDPKTDPIVRVDANRLRSRLETYYAAEGMDDEVIIDIPKGTYVPVFRRSPRTPGGHASLAILPFVNLSPAGDQDRIADSLTEELIHSLARVEHLRVIARSSVFQFKQSSLSAQDIGKTLQVDHVLEGSLRLAGGRLRITAQLVEVRHGWLLWSEKYECPWENVFAVQDEIVDSLTAALKIALGGRTQGPFIHATENAEAYADYLRGRHFWNLRTPDSLTASIRCYEQALARDPNCAPAHAGIADTLVVMALNDQEPTLTVLPRARASARKAVELRPGWPEALTSLGCVKSIFDWDWEGGARDLEDAVRRRPGAPTSHYLYGIINRAPLGRWAEAIASLQAALQLDPISPVLWRDLALIHFLRRAWTEAETAFHRAEELAPDFRGSLYWRARLFIETGRAADAIALLEQRLAAGPANTRVLATIGYAAARYGDLARARSVYEALGAKARSGRVPPLDFATISLGLGAWDDALCWLETACEERAAPLYQFATDPLYDPVRDHPRADAIRLAMGLPRITPR